MQILVDTKFWNRAYSYMGPKAILWIRQNKGKTEKHIVRNECVINLSQETIEEGFFLGLLCRSMFRAELKRTNTKPQHQHDIELSIIKAAIDTHGLSPAVLYKGRAVGLPVDDVSTQNSSLSEIQIAHGFVYFVRNGDLFKIGITENLLRRLSELQPDEVLNVVRCKNFQEVEKRIHAEFRQIRLPQTEYFRMQADHVEKAHELLHAWAVL